MKKAKEFLVLGQKAAGQMPSRPVGGLACPCKQLAGVRHRRNPASTHLLLPSFKNLDS